MMILRSAGPSPFGRKVELAAAMLGLDGEIEVVETDTVDPGDTIRHQNPLGKVPALIVDGEALYDSAIILEYLDHRVGRGDLIPTDATRFRVLTEQALADGLIEAAILEVYESRFRDAAKHEPKWIEHQRGKVARSLAAFEQRQPQGPRSVADISLACALGYLDLRFAGEWRGNHPRLVAWLDVFAADVPAFESTRFKG